MIAVPFPSPFDLELSAIEASCWEWSSEGTSKGRHDFGALTGGRWERTAGSAKRKKAVKNLGVFPFGRSPLGMEGASNRGGWGNWGSDPAHSESVSAVAGGMA